MYKTVIVHVDAEPGAADRVRLAADLARRYDARLIGVAAALARPPVEAITAGVMDASILELERDQIAADFKVAEGQFRTLTAESGITVEWRPVETFPTLALADAASAADLLVIGGGGAGRNTNDYRAVNPGDLILRAGRPILIAPRGASRLDPRSVLVAWKNTREARRAVADAMPFLKRAETVILAEVREHDEASSLADPAAFLAGHGVKFRTQLLERDGIGVGAQLTAFAGHAQADLIVLGGYGHTRIRELIFGGVTRSLIGDCPLPCLLSH
jgi:nucleotide-binding universal stress UspA family protein